MPPCPGARKTGQMTRNVEAMNRRARHTAGQAVEPGGTYARIAVPAFAAVAAPTVPMGRVPSLAACGAVSTEEPAREFPSAGCASVGHSFKEPPARESAGRPSEQGATTLGMPPGTHRGGKRPWRPSKDAPKGGLWCGQRLALALGLVAGVFGGTAASLAEPGVTDYTFRQYQAERPYVRRVVFEKWEHRKFGPAYFWAEGALQPNGLSALPHQLGFHHKSVGFWNVRRKRMELQR